MNAFGVKITLLELRKKVLPLEDPNSAEVVERAFTAAGVTVRSGAQALRWRPTDGGLDLTISMGGEESNLSCERILIATGRSPNTRELGLETSGIRCDGGGSIAVWRDYRTTAPNVYAIGDIVDTPALAHVASKEAEIAVGAILGANVEGLDHSLIPSAIYCEPQWRASVCARTRQRPWERHTRAPYFRSSLMGRRSQSVRPRVT